MSSTNTQPIQLQLIAELQTTKNYNKSIARCKQIISEIEKLTQRRLITYFSASKDIPAAFINDDDSIQIEDFLRTPNKFYGLDLILNSGGGYAISAERIINVCRNYVKKNSIKEFRVIVPRLAKSAATMVSLGADKIILCDNAELGPIDPQLILQDKNNKQFPKPAYHISSAVKKLLGDANSVFPTKNEKYLTFLRQYNYDIFTMADNEIGLSMDIAKKIAERKKATGLTLDSFSIFTDPTQTFSHGRLIGIEDLRGTNLCKVGFIVDLNEHFSKRGKEHLQQSDIEKLSALIWELYIRKTYLLNDDANPQVKVIEDASYNFISGNPDWKLPAPSVAPVPNPSP